MEKCKFRDACWNALNALAIERGKATPGRKIACGFETAATVDRCPRRSQCYGTIEAPETPVVQMRMDLSQPDQKAA